MVQPLRLRQGPLRFPMRPVWSDTGRRLPPASFRFAPLMDVGGGIDVGDEDGDEDGTEIETEAAAGPEYDGCGSYYEGAAEVATSLQKGWIRLVHYSGATTHANRVSSVKPLSNMFTKGKGEKWRIELKKQATRSRLEHERHESEERRRRHGTRKKRSEKWRRIGLVGCYTTCTHLLHS